MSMIRYYYANVDEYGMLCVDQLEDAAAHDEEVVARLADYYPDTIYFGYWPGDPEMRPAENAVSEHECEVTRADLDDLRAELQELIDTLRNDLDHLRDEVQR